MGFAELGKQRLGEQGVGQFTMDKQLPSLT
jgi:hypothetical protein